MVAKFKKTREKEDLVCQSYKFTLDKLALEQRLQGCMKNKIRLQLDSKF